MIVKAHHRVSDEELLRRMLNTVCGEGKSGLEWDALLSLVILKIS